MYRREQKGIDWGTLYANHHDRTDLDPTKLEVQIATLMADEDVTNKRGVYAYVLTGEERYLSIRAFTSRDKRTAYEQQKGICSLCGEHFDLDQMEADHITPWSKGGHTTPENCQLLCKPCNRTKSAK